MDNSVNRYSQEIEALFKRFPSFQKVGASAYKPGIDGMEEWDRAAGFPHSRFVSVHVAGTNGKGSVSHIVASVLASAGYKTALYTSPHLLDFRERMKICEGDRLYYISEEEVLAFIDKWKPYFEGHNLSFFEITTMMAFEWFASQNVDVAVIETGLGGRLDSTNIISPVLSVITNIGLDHCDMLGHTRSRIAFEKAGIIKADTPAVIGENDTEIEDVFENKASEVDAPLFNAEDMIDVDSDEFKMMLSSMDLKGVYQSHNLATACAALSVLENEGFGISSDALHQGVANAASKMRFLGRWQQIMKDGNLYIADIGHNAHGLKYNFSQYESMAKSSLYESLVMVLGFVADKDVESALSFLPEVEGRTIDIILTRASGTRAMDPEVLDSHFRNVLAEKIASGRYRITLTGDVASAMKLCTGYSGSLIYVGGSTFVVAEALPELGIL